MYKTLIEEGQCEIVIEKSRFIAHAWPITSESQAASFIETTKKKHWQATHNVPVYLLGERYDTQRFSDDGEPSGTAGLPVLDMLKKQGITNICIVITRYFGGVKLGTGGLVRAYTDAAKAVLDQAGLVTIDHYEHFECNFDYTHQGKITHLLNSYDTQGLQTNYSDKVIFNFYVPLVQAQKLHSDLIDLTSDQITIKSKAVYGGINPHTQQFLLMD